MPLFLPDTMDSEAWSELAAYDRTRWVCYRQIQGWVVVAEVAQHPRRRDVVEWQMTLIDAEGVEHPFKGEFRGKVPPPPVYRTRFLRKAVI